MNNMVVEALRYMLAEVEEKLTSVEEENARLKMIIDDYRSDIAKVLNDRCPTDEKHCGCVPILRGEINNYKKTLELIINVSELSQAITLARRALEEVRDE